VYSSFGVIRSDSPKATYNAYFSGHINVTGIRKRSDIEEAVQHFLSLAGLQQASVKVAPRIDNISCGGRYGIDVCITEIIEVLEELDNLVEGTDLVDSIRFKPDHFGGIHVHFPKKFGGGLITLFSTGSYSLVGVRTEERAKEIYEQFYRVLLSIHCRKGRQLL
jgi:TATA-box binding protein (TBP) (component of TFIID and TFIIIB)